MKYPAEHKPAVTHRLKLRAAQQIRAKGLDRVSVKSVMAAENMTVGGFYAHFESKDAMLAEAIRTAFAESIQGLARLIDKRGDQAWLKQATQAYLSVWHRDHHEIGCPIAALMSDIARAEPALKQVFEDELQRMAAVYVQRLKAIGHRDAEDTAMAVMSLLAGALQLSRSVVDSKLSGRILGSAVTAAWNLLDRKSDAP